MSTNNPSERSAQSTRHNEHNSSSSCTTTGGTATGLGGGKKSSNLNKNAMDQNQNRFFVMTQWRILFGCCCLIIASYFGYVGYLETRVNTPFDEHKVIEFLYSSKNKM